ncbi:MAG: pentapeptide repeat-containing protein [Fibrobacteres bacterium]|nr:pentapeptide repeat-containing protein [Fibrobacterota bacterium]
MKEQIEQVLRMNKDGKLTDAQTAELLAELARPGEAHASGPGWGRGSVLEPLVSKVNETLKSALDSAFAWNESRDHRDEAWANPSARNSIHMSRFDYPEGKDVVFTGNVIRMSSMKDLRMDRSEMTGNTIDMSKADDLRLRDAKLQDCEIRASSVDDWHLDGSTLDAIMVQGSRVADLQCTDRSELRKARIQGVSLKGFRLAEGSKAENLLLNGSSLADIRLLRSEWGDSEILNSSVSDLALESCRAARFLIRSLSAKKAVFSDCTLTDVAFSAETRWAWKKHGLKDVRIDGCDWEKVAFSDCRLDNCVIKNVTLRDRQFRGLDLADLRIDGTEAFLKAVGG